METLSKIEVLIIKYKNTLGVGNEIVNSKPDDLFGSNDLPKAVKFAATIAMIKTYENVIKDLETLLLP